MTIFFRRSGTSHDDRRSSRPGGLRVRQVTARAMPEIGGIEAHVAEVASRLAVRGYGVEVITTDRRGDLLKVERVPTAVPGATYVVRRHRAVPRERDWYLSPGLFWAVLRSRADVIHVQGIHTLVPPLAMLAAILRRIPFVVTFHTGGSSSDFRARARGTQWRILAPLLRRAAALVAVSEFEAGTFREVLGPDVPVQVVRNGGGLPAGAGAGVPRTAVDPDLVVSTGRLERYKGHHRVIEALPLLLEQRPDAHVEILGSGPYEAELVALAERLGVSDRVVVRYIPPLDRAGMAESLGRAGVVALLSDYEAHPVAVMEALALGRPVLVARTSGLTELAETGWVAGIAADASPAAVAQALFAQLTDPVGVDPSVLPTWDGCVDEVEAVYREAVGRRRDPVAS